MGILIGLWRQIRDEWDTPSQVALAVDVVSLIVVGYVFYTDPGLRVPAAVGLVGLLIGLQLIVLWGNRGMVTPYTQAQRQFLSGDFEDARDTLQHIMDEKAAAGKRAGVDVYVLLGNTYRHLSQLDKSENLLRQALDFRPRYHFPLYGLGKTRMAKGEYAAAAELIEQALNEGAPTIVTFDLAHAYARLGDREQARHWLSRTPPPDEPYRELMTAYLLHRLGNAEPPSGQLIERGIAFWEAEAERYRVTPYGRDIADDIAYLKELY